MPSDDERELKSATPEAASTPVVEDPPEAEAVEAASHHSSDDVVETPEPSDSESEAAKADELESEGSEAGDGDKVKVAKKEQFADDIALPGASVENVKMLSRRIPVTFLRDRLSDRVHARHMMRDFILHIPFVIAFTFFMFGFRSISEEYFFAESAKNFLVKENLPPTNPVPGSEPNGNPYFPKNFLEIGNYGDVYDWLEGVLVPRLFTDDPAGREIQNRRFGGQNQLLGAVRIRAKRVRGDTCTPNSQWYPANETLFPKVCYGPMTMANEEKEQLVGDDGTHYNYTDQCDTYPLQWLSGKYAFYDCSGYTFDVPFNTTLSDALTFVNNMRNNDIFRTEKMRLFIVEFFSYNPAINTFMSVKLIVEITEGGGFLPWPRVRPFVVFPGDAFWIGYNIFFLVMVLFYMQRFIVDWMRNARMTRSKVNFLLSVWNLMQLANLIIFIPVYILFFRWVYYSAKVDILYPSATETNEEVDQYPSILGAVSELYQTQVYLNAVNTMFTFLVILKFAQLNERLSILQATVGNAVQPLMAVLIIFVIVVISYAIAGTLIFGTGVEAFRNVDTAFVGLFRVLVGDFDYWTLWRENRALAFIFFWSFVILALFILLNFIVAIMMGAFSEENAKLKPKSVAVLLTETVDRQKNTLIARIKKIAHVACSDKQMPEDMLLEKLNEYLEDYTKDAVAADDEFEIESFEFGRYDLFKIIPRAELEDIGDEYLDGMWFAIVDDYNNTLDDDADVEKEAVSQHVYEFVKEAIGEHFNDFRLKMFGDKNFLAQIDNRRLYLDHDVREQAQSMYQAISDVPSVPIRLQNGKVPTDLLQYITELAARSTAIQRKMALSRGLTLDATDECPAPVRREAIPHALPPLVPPFSAQPIVDSHGELPDPEDATRRALRIRRQQMKVNGRTGGGNTNGGQQSPQMAQSMMAASGVMDQSMLNLMAAEAAAEAGSIDDPPPQPIAVPAALPLAERVVEEFNGNKLPAGGDWILTDSAAYVWCRTRQCFLHAPSGHFCTPDGRQWVVLESGRNTWMTAVERRAFLDKQISDAAAEEKKAALERANRSCEATVTLSVAEARREAERTAATRWPADMSKVPLAKPHNIKGADAAQWAPSRTFAYSPPPIGKWDAVNGADGFFMDREHGLLFFAHVGHYFEPANRMWFVPSQGKWLTPAEHEQTLAQLAVAGKY